MDKHKKLWDYIKSYTKKEDKKNDYVYFVSLTMFIVLTIIVIILFIFFIYNLILVPSESLTIDTLAAFSGAFFAFVFLRIGDMLNKHYEGQKKHYNALVSMELYLDELASIIYDNIYLLPSFRQVIVSGNVYTSFPKLFPVRKDYFELLNDIKLINDYYIITYDIRRLNDDVENTIDWYLHLRELYTTGKMSLPEYIKNSVTVADQLKVLQAGMELLIEKVINLRSIVTLRAEFDKPIFTRVSHKLIERFRIDLSKEMIDAKVAKIKSEIEETAEKSQPNIEKIRNRATELD